MMSDGSGVHGIKKVLEYPQKNTQMNVKKYNLKQIVDSSSFEFLPVVSLTKKKSFVLKP